MHHHVIVTDKNLYSGYRAVNYVTNTVEVKISLIKSNVLKLVLHYLFSQNLNPLSGGFQ